MNRNLDNAWQLPATFGVAVITTVSTLDRPRLCREASRSDERAGHLRAHHRFRLEHLPAHLDDQIATLSDKFRQLIVPFLPAEADQRLDAIPGVSRRQRQVHIDGHWLDRIVQEQENLKTGRRRGSM